jgi:uncharacterized protein involved in exopolysaccharide biosynthesis
MMVSVGQKRWIFVRRYLWRVVLFALAALIYSWIATHATRTTYKAETELAFKSTEMPVRFEFLKLFSNPLPIFLEDDIYSLTYDIPSVVSSDKITERVIERGKFKERLYSPKEYPVYKEWFDDFHAHLMFEMHPDTKSMTIAYAADTPELAREITSLYSDEFEKYFSGLYWRYSVADAIQEAYNRRADELAQIEAKIDEYIVSKNKIAVKRGAAQDVMNYLYAEKAKLLSTAEIRGYDAAIERVRKEMVTAGKGEEFSPVTEALFDYVLVFLKSLYADGEKKLAELQYEYTPENPQVVQLKKVMDVTEMLIKRYSLGAVETSINTLTMRSLEAKARNEFWTEKAAKLKTKIQTLPGFEEDLTWLMRKQNMYEVALWFWGRRLEFHRLGEELTDDPFVTIDEPIVPDRAYYPILGTWSYAFPVLLMVGTLWFLLRYKLEEECLEDISKGRI